MRREAIAALASLACIAGCNSTGRVVTQGQPVEFAVPAGPLDMANCMARNATSFPGSYSTSVAELIRPDNYEVVVTQVAAGHPLQPRNPIIVARTWPAYPARGSQIALYMSDDFGSAEAADWIARLRKGC